MPGVEVSGKRTGYSVCKEELKVERDGEISFSTFVPQPDLERELDHCLPFKLLPRNMSHKYRCEPL